MARLLIGGLIVLTIGAVLGLQHARSLLEPASSEPRPQLFEVVPGDSLGGIAVRLERAGLARSAAATKLLARWRDVEGRLQVGEYELSPHQSTQEILGSLVSGHVKTYSITVPEGSRAAEIAQRLEAAGLADAGAFMRAVEDPELIAALGVPGASLEGYLYPDTYHLPRKRPAAEIARNMVALFEQVWQNEIAPLADATSLDKAEIVTLASIVEKETALPEERGLIAGVFLNRLEKGMRLETDPSVIYGIADFDGNIKKRHLLDESNPYNTYRIRGLPPGPIANPGADAMLAVVRPSETDYLYFVSRNDGTHHFSHSYREHIDAVNRYQKRRRARPEVVERETASASEPGT